VNAQNNGHEHELEPEFGLPEPLPRGETILWQGAPDFGEIAIRVFHLRKAVFYFVALLLARGIQLWMSDVGLLGTLMGMLVPISLAVIGLAAIVTLAWLTARTTAYTLTDQRVVMRVGIVLTLTFNLPLRTISTASLHITDKGFGDIPLALAGGARIAWLHLWPHTRPWRVAHPEPMLRCVPEARAVAALLSKAWVAATGNQQALAKPSVTNNATSIPLPSTPPQGYAKPAAQSHQWEATLT
jgi:Bacterial PH domain